PSLCPPHRTQSPSCRVGRYIARTPTSYSPHQPTRLDALDSFLAAHHGATYGPARQPNTMRSARPPHTEPSYVSIFYMHCGLFGFAIYAHCILCCLLFVFVLSIRTRL
ncbi:hypothetical protein RSAG8_11706, partial [Rhizoctonia solani AG-8 WAC10335]